MSVVEHLRATQGLIGRTQLAAMLGTHPQTLWGWCAEGKIPHTRVGCRLKFDPGVVAEWLEKREVGGL